MLEDKSAIAATECTRVQRFNGPSVQTSPISFHVKTGFLMEDEAACRLVIHPVMKASH